MFYVQSFENNTFFVIVPPFTGIHREFAMPYVTIHPDSGSMCIATHTWQVPSATHHHNCPCGRQTHLFTNVKLTSNGFADRDPDSEVVCDTSERSHKPNIDSLGRRIFDEHLHLALHRMPLSSRQNLHLSQACAPFVTFEGRCPMKTRRPMTASSIRSSRLDHCNAWWHGATRAILNELQRTPHNASACLVTKLQCRDQRCIAAPAAAHWLAARRSTVTKTSPGTSPFRR